MKFVKVKRVDQSDHGHFSRRKLKKYEQAMPRAKQQRLWTRVKSRVIFTIRQSLHCFDCCDRENIHFNSRKAYVTGEGLESRVEAANYAGINCVFKTCEICLFDTPVLGQFLSDFARVKSCVSPRL